MPRDPCRAASGQPRSPRDVSRRDAVARETGAYSFRQWPRLHRQGAATVAGGVGCPDAVHRPRQSVGERLLRELQRQAAGRVLERRTFLFAQGGADRDRTVASAVQHPPAAFVAGLPAAGAGSLSPHHLHERNSKVAGCDVDSHSAWYKTSVRSARATGTGCPSKRGSAMQTYSKTYTTYSLRRQP